METVDQLFHGMLSHYWGAIYQRLLVFVCSINHNLPYLFLSREDNHDIRDIGKHDFHSVLFQPVLSNANQANKNIEFGMHEVMG